MNQVDLELEFLIDFPLPRLRFRWRRLGSIRTRAEDSRFFFGIIYLDHNFVLRSINPPFSSFRPGAIGAKRRWDFCPNLVHQYFLSIL